MEPPREKRYIICLSVANNLDPSEEIPPLHPTQTACRGALLSRLDYGNALLFHPPAYLHNQLQRVQNAEASFVRGFYSTQVDVVHPISRSPPVEERSALQN